MGGRTLTVSLKIEGRFPKLTLLLPCLLQTQQINHPRRHGDGQVPAVRGEGDVAEALLEGPVMKSLAGGAVEDGVAAVGENGEVAAIGGEGYLIGGAGSLIENGGVGRLGFGPGPGAQPIVRGSDEELPAVGGEGGGIGQELFVFPAKDFFVYWPLRKGETMLS